MPLSQWRNVWHCTACQVYDWSGPVAYPPQKAVGVNAHTASVSFKTGLCEWKQQCIRVRMLHASESLAQCVCCTACQVYDWSGPVAYPPRKSVGVTADTASVSFKTGLCDWSQQCMRVSMLYAPESVAQCVALYGMSSV